MKPHTKLITVIEATSRGVEAESEAGRCLMSWPDLRAAASAANAPELREHYAIALRDAIDLIDRTEREATRARISACDHARAVEDERPYPFMGGAWWGALRVALLVRRASSAAPERRSPRGGRVVAR